MIFHPLIKNSLFHEQTFQRQQTNLVAYINALKDDKQSYAALQLQQLYFGKDEIQSTPTFGEADQIAQITNQDLFDYYKKVLAHDRVEIFVVGDVNATQIQTIVQKWPLSERFDDNTDISSLSYPEKQIRQKTEVQSIVQSKLDLAYQFPTNFRDSVYYAGIVFNALFGGSPLSKLFLNVREKASLAYYATSNVDVFNGLMIVQTGINAADKEQVLAIVAQQLKDIQAGDFSEDHLAQIKTGLTSNYIASLDAERSYTSRALTNRLVDSQTSTKEWIAAIQKVSRSEIMSVAKQVHLTTSYFLSSEVKEHA
nr:pitrilysin family protein [Pediococcus ethanolidurans]